MDCVPPDLSKSGLSGQVKNGTTSVFQKRGGRHRGLPTSTFSVGADSREGEEDSNFSVFRVRRFTESPGPLH